EIDLTIQGGRFAMNRSNEGVATSTNHTHSDFTACSHVDAPS
ncbi:MAG: hypothetical protein ACI9QL_001881, partial [Candidatus Omnitrophota bacterium]